MKNLISILILILVLIAARSNVRAATGALPPATNRIVLSGEYISLLAERLRTHHPAVQAAAARAEAAVKTANAVRTWADPMVRLGGVAAREPMRADEGDLIYGIEQKLPLFGKPPPGRKVAQAETDVARANTEFQFQLRRVRSAEH